MQIINSFHKLVWLTLLSLLKLSLAPAPGIILPSKELDSYESQGKSPGLHTQIEWGKMPLYFIANQGQMDDQVAY